MLAPSLLDRLIDACDGVAEPQPARVERLIDDIEDLLSTCSLAVDPAVAGYPETARSLLGYGSPAPAAMAVATHKERLATATQIEATLRRFEPRLAKVRVSLDETGSRPGQGRFFLEASLADEPATRVSLAMRVKTGSGRTEITTERA